jgi:hypothetical protein
MDNKINPPAPKANVTYLLVSFDYILHEVDGSRLQTRHVCPAVLLQEVMQFFLASESLLEIKNANLRELG